MWAILDQGLSSGSNFAFGIAAAQALPLPDFGFYAVLAAVYWLVIGSARAVVGETLLVVPPDRPDRAPAATLLVGAVGGALVAVAAVALPDRAAELLTLAALLPVLAYQDGLRYLCFRTARYRAAFGSDLIWLAVFLGAYAWLRAGTEPPTVVTLTLAWGLGAAVACLVGVPLRAAPWALRGARDWLAAHRTLAGRTWGEFVIGSGTAQAVIFGIPLVASLSTAAELKIAQLAVAPWQVTITALSVLVIPRIAARSREPDPRAGLRICRRLSVAAATLGTGYVLVVVLLPVTWGRAVFGAGWAAASHPAWVYAMAATLIATSQSVVYLMRATGTSGRLLVARGVLAPITLAVTLTGAATAGATGAAWGFVGTAALTVALWWRLALVPLPASRRSPAPPTEGLTHVRG